MPYYPEDQSSENLNKIRWNNVCSECGRMLYLYHDSKSKLTYIACPTSGHEGIARKYKKPEEDYQSDLRRLFEMEQTHGLETSRALQKLPTTGRLTQPQAMQILELVYPGVPKDEIIRCAILCRDFGLHPLMKEVYIIPFGQGEKRTWSTVLGIGATRKLMAQRGTFSYLDNTPRVMTKKEQETIFGEVDDKNIVAITKLQTREGEEAQGYGRWPNDKDPFGTDKGNSKANMAFIRSERNAFGRLFTDAIPQGIEVIDEAYVDVPGVGKVIGTTGEVAQELEEASEAPPETAQAVPSTTKEEDKRKPQIDMQWLYESCHRLHWQDTTIISYLHTKYHIPKGDSIEDMVVQLAPEDAQEFTKEIQDRLGML